MKDLTNLDWDDFREDHPAFERIIERLKVHSQQAGENHKRWLIPGWVGKDDLIVIFGPSEAGKSVFATDLACRLAAGWDLDGNVEPCVRNVLYIAAERGGQVRRRVDAFCKHHGGKPFPNLAIYDGPIDLTQPKELLAIVRVAARAMREEIDVVFIDTLAAAMSGADSDPSAMARAVNALTDTTRNGNDEAEGCAVVVVHHTTLSGETRMRGGGQLQGAADMSILVTRKKGASTATVRKNNETAERPSRSFTMATVNLGRDFDDVPDTTAPVLVAVGTASDRPVAVKAGGPTKAQRQALDTLRAAVVANDGKPVTETAWRDAVYLAAGDITDAGKRMQFSRQRKLVADGLATESEGLFAAA